MMTAVGLGSWVVGVVAPPAELAELTGIFQMTAPR